MSSDPSPSSLTSFDAILLTASNASQAAAFESEVRRRQLQGSLPCMPRTRVLVICDPAGQRIGSGGATLAAMNALLECMAGDSREDKVQQLKRMRIGLFHSGGDSQRLPTCSVRGKAFCGMPADPPPSSDDELTDDSSSITSASPLGLFESTPLDFLIRRVSPLLQCPGVIIAATDCLLDFPEDYPIIRAGSEQSRGVVGCTVRAKKEMGSVHGVFVTNDASSSSNIDAATPPCGFFPVVNILQKASQSELASAHAIDSRTQTVLLDAGLIFLCPDAVESLLALAVTAPFDSCCQPTEPVVGSAPTTPVRKAFRFELYTDILLPMNPALTLPMFLASSPPDASCPPAILKSARERLWAALHPFKCFAAVHPTASFFHMGTQQERMQFMFEGENGSTSRCTALRQQTRFRRQAHACFDQPQVAEASKGAALLNCMLQSCPEDDGMGITPPLLSTSASPPSHLAAGSFLEYSHLRGSFSTGAGALVSGVRSAAIATGLHVPPYVCVQETQMHQGWSEVLGIATDPTASSNIGAGGSPSAPPPAVISIFHSDDSIKTPYTDRARASFLGVPFLHFLAQVATRAGVPLAEVVQQVWPNASSDSQRTLWSARLFAIFQAAETIPPGETPRFYPFHSDPQLSKWMLNVKHSTAGAVASSSSSDSAEGYPCRAVLVQWLATPRASFQDVLACADGAAESLWREKLAALIDRRKLQQHLLFENEQKCDIAEDAPSHSLIASLLARAHATHLLYPRSNLLQPLFRALDSWGVQCAASLTRLDVAARVCWLQSSLLQLLFPAAAAGSVDSTLAPSSRSALHLSLSSVRARLSACDLSTSPRVLPWALATLSEARRQVQQRRDEPAWEVSNDIDQIRALYTQAAATMGRFSVCQPSDIAFTTRLQSSPLLPPLLPGSVLSLSGCVRMDLFGGWTDTPPVCFERGGSVINVALSIDGELPLKVKGSVHLVESHAASSSLSSPLAPPPILVQLGSDPSDASAAVELRSLSDFLTHSDPSSPGALIKCVLIAMGIVRMPETHSPATGSAKVPNLEEQLTAAYWSGKTDVAAALTTSNIADDFSSASSSPLPPIRLQLACWVALGSVSQGTGLGVSSLLAADLIMVVARLFDRVYTPLAVSYLVLLVEQLLSSCGGWQDQVGGMWPGFKLAHSQKGLPLRLEVQPLHVSSSRVADFNDRLLLVHTGMPRLARNLLRTVLDHWAKRDPKLVALFERLQTGADEMAHAIQRGDWIQTGRLLSEYWSMKRQLATPSGAHSASSPPAEPAHVTAFLQATSHLCLGASLAGAGGGGFLALFAEPSQHAEIRAQLARFNQQQTDARANGAAADAWVPYRIYAAAVCAEEGEQVRMDVVSQE